MNKDEIIIKTCPHVSYTDYGVYACSLYKPKDKNSFVKFGTCGANKTCPYKIAELKTQECEKCIKALEEIEKIVNEPCIVDAQEDCKHCDNWCEHKDILDIINKAKGEGNEQL